MNLSINKKQFIKDIFLKIFYGLFMGVSDGIPGYSGGTTLSLFNYYDELIKKSKLIFSRAKFKSKIFTFLDLLPFLLSWIIFLILFSFASSKIASVGIDYQVILFFLFFSFSLFCIPIFWLVNIHKIKNEISAKKTKSKLFYMIFFFLSFMIMITIGIIIYFNGGISLEKETSSTNVIEFNTRVIFILFTCFMSGFAMLIPGISGSLILFLANTYKDVYWVILQNPFDNIYLLLLVVASILLGILTSIFTINFLIKKNYFTFKFISLGLVIGSPIAMILSFMGNSQLVNGLTNMFGINANANVVIFVLVIALALIINTSLFWVNKMNNNVLNKIIVNQNSALFIVDVQNDFYVGGSLGVKDSFLIKEPIIKLIDFFKKNNMKIILSKDYHPNNHVSFKTWPIHCVENTYGSKIVDWIKTDDCLVVKKGTFIHVDNYSAFYDGDNKSCLDDYLKKNKISHLYLVGLAGDYCVKNTALDALKFGYNITLIKDGIKSIDSNFDLDSIDKKINVI